MNSSAAIQNCNWDAIVVGTGMGGATIGYALAKAGKKVLFCEKGKSLSAADREFRGGYAETYFDEHEVPSAKHQQVLLNSGRWVEEITDVSSTRPRRFIPFLGSGSGGSTAIYGAILERFFPIDFEPGRKYPDATEPSLPDRWPITYDQLAPYYEEAEKLFRVRGTADPCRDHLDTEHFRSPPTLSDSAAELQSYLVSKGLRPYRPPLACEFVSQCQGCQGFLCPHECRNDADRVCLRPAIEEFGAVLLDECDVKQILATRHEITGVVCDHKDQEYVLRADNVILAAGALETPRLLLTSSSSDWPDGLANESGMVGRNLMRHFIDLYVVKTKTPHDRSCNLKELAFNDFYYSDGRAFGTVQSFGAMPPVPVIVASLQKDFENCRFPLAPWLFRVAKPILARYVTSMFEGGLVFASIMEDLPHAENRVLDKANRTAENANRRRISYSILEYDRRRIAAFRATLRKTFKPYRATLIKQAHANERLAHVCGTCRFGDDPQSSVLDRWNRAHGLANLFVVDGSFFPSSAALNPGLTIAANALRIADYLTKQDLGEAPKQLVQTQD